MTPFRSELPFASLVTYCPRGDSRDIRSSRNLMLQVKENRVLQSSRGVEPAASFMARRLREIGPDFVTEFLGPDVTLVPVPRSGMQKPGALWPASELANALRNEGFGHGVLPCLERVHAVLKAATAPAKERPKPRTHFESLRVLDPIAMPTVVTLVDDVVTRGAQMVGAAWAIWAMRPDIKVRGFAFIRTISDPDGFERIASPCVGKIEVRRGECFRSP